MIEILEDYVRFIYENKTKEQNLFLISLIMKQRDYLTSYHKIMNSTFITNLVGFIKDSYWGPCTAITNQEFNYIPVFSLIQNSPLNSDIFVDVRVYYLENCHLMILKCTCKYRNMKFPTFNIISYMILYEFIKKKNYLYIFLLANFHNIAIFKYVCYGIYFRCFDA